MYKLKTEEFTAPNGSKATFTYRENTNDRDTIVGAYVEDEYKVLELDLKEKNVVMDIGAHIGAVTLLLASIRDDLKVFAYEAMPDNFDLLLKNVQNNQSKSEVNIFQQAMWFYDDDEIKMYYGDNSKDGKIHKFIGSQFLLSGFRDKRVFKFVKATNISKAFDDNRIFHCHFMKIDVEGAEYGILKGAPKEVLKMIDIIRGEYHNIEPDQIKMPRQRLLKQTKGVFKDVTCQPEKGPVGPFTFERKK